MSGGTPLPLGPSPSTSSFPLQPVLSHTVLHSSQLPLLNFHAQSTLHDNNLPPVNVPPASYHPYSLTIIITTYIIT